MLDWLASKLKQKDGAHPLGTETGLRDFLAGVPTTHPAHTLRELGDWLGDPERLAADISPPALRRAVRTLDEFAQEALAQVWSLLFTAADHGLAEDHWLAVSRYCGQAAMGYRAALQHFPPEGSIGAQERSELGLFALRATALLATQNKLTRMRYRVSGPEQWAALHEIYRLARNRGVAATTYPIYRGDRGSNVQAEYLRGLLFETAPLDNITPRQMEVVDLFLKATATQLLLREFHDERTPFFVDVQSAMAPLRWNPAAAAPPEGRFFGAGSAYPELALAAAALQRGAPPAWLAAAPGNRDEQSQVLLLLRDQWSKEPPRRRFRRATEAGELLVVHGFAQVRRMVAAAAYARSGRKMPRFTGLDVRSRIQRDYFGTVAYADEATVEADGDEVQSPREMLERLELAGDKDMMDHWQVADTSAKGLGAIAPHHKQWLRVGALTSYRREASIYWELAVIRRLSRSREGRRLVGLELLPGVPIPVHVKAVTEGEADTLALTPVSLAEFNDGILVSAEAGTLLLEPGRQKVGEHLLLAGDSLRLTVRLVERIEKAAEFEFFRYEAAS